MSFIVILILFHKIFEISTLKSRAAIEFCETVINHKAIANAFLLLLLFVVVEFDSWQFYAPYSHIYDNILLIANFYFMFDGQTERKQKKQQQHNHHQHQWNVCVHCIIRFPLVLLLLRCCFGVDVAFIVIDLVKSKNS